MSKPFDTAQGVLYVVATPIGNLEDITLRALRVLKEVEMIFAEDTRVTKKLLSHYDISTQVERLDAQVEETKAQKVIKYLEKEEDVALVSDAGTPTISDPGSRLVSAVREAGYEVVAIPGASALTAAFSIAGVGASEFLFLGFLPHKKGRQTLFEEIAHAKRTIVFYESPHRILKTFTALVEHLGKQHHVVIARELTKVHEEVVSGTPEEVFNYFEDNPDKVRGEFVVIISSKD